jgi:hypothetical protein
MKTRSILLLFPLFCAMAVAAQTAKPATEGQPAKPATQGQTAKPAAKGTTAKPSAGRPTGDAAARKQLAAKLAAFQSKPDDATLRSEIVALAKSMSAAPPIPQAARDSFAAATVQLQAATTPDANKAAAQLFEQVAVQAPWYADAYLSAATAYGQANDFDAAQRNLAIYFAAVRTGVSTQSAEALRSDLGRRQTDQQIQQALKQFQANPNDAARRQIIKLALGLKPPPEIPEEARSHFVMAAVLVSSADDNPDDAKRAVEEYKAALMAAPWWGDGYKKLAAAQKAAGQYGDAIASLNLYQLTQTGENRDTQDEIYRLTVEQRMAADEEAKAKAEAKQQKALEEQQAQDRASAEAKHYTVAGRWYEVPLPGDYFVGGQSKPECDYVVSQNGGRWSIANSCSRGAWAFDAIQVIGKQISFHLSGHNPGYPFTLVTVQFTLSDDGQTLIGQDAVYNNGTEHLGDHAVQWKRRE